MFGSATGKVLALTMAIIGVVVLYAKMTSTTEFNNTGKQHQKEYFDKMKEGRAEAEQLDRERQELYEWHSELDSIGRSLYSVKSAVKRHKSKTGEMPEDITVLGMDSKKAADGKYTESIKIDNGEIYAFLTSDYGDGAILRVNYTGTYGKEWSCTTNLALEGKNSIAGMPCVEDVNIEFNGTNFQ